MGEEAIERGQGEGRETWRARLGYHRTRGELMARLVSFILCGPYCSGMQAFLRCDSPATKGDDVRSGAE
jgi:hypothetical protein